MIVLDTDCLTLLERRDRPEAQTILDLLSSRNEMRCTTIVNYEEKMRGWFGLIASAKSVDYLVQLYARLQREIDLFEATELLAFDENAAAIYEGLRRSRIRVGTMDLRIASIVMANQATLLTRNRRDFERIPDLLLETF